MVYRSSEARLFRRRRLATIECALPKLFIVSAQVRRHLVTLRFGFRRAIYRRLLGRPIYLSDCARRIDRVTE